MEKRIISDKIELDYGSILDFFEHRGENKELSSKYNYVLYQDDCPEIAIQRDLMEKEKISRILDLREGQRVLDIGCGIGRWGEYLLKKNIYYVGIDVSKKMITLAENLLRQFHNKKLLIGNIREFIEVLKNANETEKFDKIFVNGVFMYLNDIDYEKALTDIYEICAGNCEIYIKESMGIEKRLTLSQIFSESLSQTYSAIYRSIEEYRETLCKVLEPEFKLSAEGNLFDEKLSNRVETTDYYFIWKHQLHKHKV